MPYKAEKIKLPSEYDRRVKLSAEQRDEIRHKYSTGLYSLNSLAKEYNVSKKLILVTVNPESKRKADEYVKTHWKKYQGTREERNVVAKEHRAYKHKLHKEGKI